MLTLCVRGSRVFALVLLCRYVAYVFSLIWHPSCKGVRVVYFSHCIFLVGVNIYLYFSKVPLPHGAVVLALTCGCSIFYSFLIGLFPELCWLTFLALPESKTQCRLL